MADGMAELERELARLRKLEELPKTLAPRVAAAVRRDVLEHVRRGESPDGRPWPPTLDGHLPLQGAGEALDVRAAGDKVVATLVGPEARHHLGQVRGGKARPILPTNAMPSSMTRAVRAVADAAFLETMERGR